MGKITDGLLKLEDKKYGDFQSNLIPTVDKKTVIGIRTPELKAYAKKLSKEADIDGNVKKQLEKFLSTLPHKYFDENQLHDFLLSEIKDFDECMKKVELFLPYIDNWATCDQLSPKAFKKNKKELLKHIKKWIKSNKPYTIRFAVGMLMEHFLDEDFDKSYLDMVAKINFKSNNKFGRNVTKAQSKTGKMTNEVTKETKNNLKRNSEKNIVGEQINVKKDPDKYYVEMMRAWYFATALAKQYDDSYKIIKDKKLNQWTHNKTIQKAIESYRVSDKHKKEIKKLKIKNNN